MAVSTLIWPRLALAQYVSPIIVALALSPLFVFLLAIILGFVTRSWWVAIRHSGLIGVWILLFWAASYWVESDYVIWTPLALFGIHAAVMVALIIRGVLRRVRG